MRDFISMTSGFTMHAPRIQEDTWKKLGSQGESWHPFNAPILMKLSPNIPGTFMVLLTPQRGVSGTSPYSKTPGKYLEVGESLDTLLMHQSWWNFNQTFQGPLWLFWNHKKGCQEPPHPPRLQEDTWRMGESWQSFNAPILMKLSPNILGTFMVLLTPQRGVSGTSPSSMTPGRKLEDGQSLDTLLVCQSWLEINQMS